METVPEFVAMLRPDGSTEYLNQRWEEYTGLPVRMPGTTWSKAFYPEDKDRFLSSFYKAIAAGQSFQDEIRIRSRDGGYRWFLTRIIPMKREGEIFAWLGTATDIDIRKRAEEELRAINESLEDRMRERSERILEYAQDLARSNQMLEHRNRELQDIAYVASHDLQEPLRKIHTFADLVKEAYADKVDAQGQFYIGRLQQASLHASELVRELLEFSHVVTPGGPFQKVDLNDVVKEVISDCAEKLEGTGGRIEVGTLPVIVADEVQIHQLLKNLVSNALKFRHPDVPPFVHIAADVEMERLDSIPEPQPVCTIEVRDNGIGFEEKYLDRIFSPFQRLHGKDEYPGTGMGLAIARRIVERHRGEITARSTPGEGSVFIVKLPTGQS
jgi:PAS domain S-box-containing protein